MSHWTVDEGSVVGIGRSQTGKSSIAKEVFATGNRLNIWLNEAGKERERGIAEHADAVVQGMKGLEKALAQNAWNIEFVSNNRERHVQELQEWLWRKADAANRNLPITLYIDEFHELAPQTNEKNVPPRDAIRKMAKRGMKRNIKLWLITQDPVAADKQPMRQREYLYVTSVSSEQRKAISDYANDLGAVNETGQYEAVVYHAEGNILHRGVKAQRRYA